MFQRGGSTTNQNSMPMKCLRHRKTRLWHSSCWPGAVAKKDVSSKSPGEWFAWQVCMYLYDKLHVCFLYIYIVISYDSRHYDVCLHMMCDSCFNQIHMYFLGYLGVGRRDWWHVAILSSPPGGLPWQARASLRSGRETQSVDWGENFSPTWGDFQKCLLHNWISIHKWMTTESSPISGNHHMEVSCTHGYP